MNKFQEEINRLAKAGIDCLENIDLKSSCTSDGSYYDVLIFGGILRLSALESTNVVAKRVMNTLLDVRNLIDNQIDMLKEKT